MNFSKHLFRCSGLGYLMTEPRSKSEELSATTKTYLHEIYIREKYQREKNIDSKYLVKGLLVEEDALTLYSRYKKEYYTKNEERFNSEYLTGHPDILTDIVIDIKSSWDIYTFLNVKTNKLNKNYYWQLQGYMMLAGLSKATLAYCLIDTPSALINDEKRRLMWKMNAISDEDPLFQEASKEIERQMTFSDIPLEERVIEEEILYNEDDLLKLYTRIEQCRNYLNSL